MKARNGKSKTHQQEQDQDTRRQEGEERDAKWRAFTRSEKLVALDGRLGMGVGAKRQRARLNP
jgi:hypothetical protein